MFDTRPMSLPVPNRTMLPVKSHEGDAMLISLGETHEAMTAAVLSGGGLERVADLASEAIGGPVAIIVPGHGAAVAACGDAGEGIGLGPLEEWVVERLRGRPAAVPVDVLAEAQIRLREEIVGVALLLRGDTAVSPEAAALLRLAAGAALTELAIEEVRAQTERGLRGSLLDELRTRDDLPVEEICRRAARLGCDLSRGASALCLELTAGRPHLALATIEGEHPGSLAEELGGTGSDGRRRIYAFLPAAGLDVDPETLAGRLAARLQRYGLVGTSSFHADPRELRHALSEAEFVLELSEHWGSPVSEEAGNATYRLLFRTLASNPQEVHDFYRLTLAPLVDYDDHNRTELVATLAAYLRANCNMNATAAMLFAHRHTIAYRLERIRELTGLDPALCEDRERLGLALKVRRLLSPRLERPVARAVSPP